MRPKPRDIHCSRCRGTGWLFREDGEGDFHTVSGRQGEQYDCPDCNGTGVILTPRERTDYPRSSEPL